MKTKITPQKRWKTFASKSTQFRYFGDFEREVPHFRNRVFDGVELGCFGRLFHGPVRFRASLETRYKARGLELDYQRVGLDRGIDFCVWLRPKWLGLFFWYRAQSGYRLFAYDWRYLYGMLDAGDDGCELVHKSTRRRVYSGGF